MNVRHTVVNGSDGLTYIQSTETSFDEATGLGTRKSALTPVKAEKAQEIMQKLASGEYAFRFGTKQRGTNYEGIIAVAEEVEA